MSDKITYLVTQDIILPTGDVIGTGTEVEVTSNAQEFIITHGDKTVNIPREMGMTLLATGVLKND